jgi:ABC-type transport system involved in cytochrome c biogenesis ATPase subunit
VPSIVERMALTAHPRRPALAQDRASTAFWLRRRLDPAARFCGPRVHNSVQQASYTSGLLLGAAHAHAARLKHARRSEMIQESRAVLAKLLEQGQLEPFIRHIRFPRYKNLAPDTHITFDYPITALVGVNGTNKSSILRALQGAPGSNNLGTYWFSTSIDPIAETGATPNCFVYGYHHHGASEIVEVLKTRVRKEKDPDYWEPSRAIRSYGMEKFRKGTADNKNKTRWDTIEKDTVYIDFRQSLSAFDKYFYHSEPRRAGTLRDRKALVRNRAPHLKNAIQKQSSSYLFYGKNRIVNSENRQLTPDELAAVSTILGRQYVEIRWVRHLFFDGDAYTCVLRMGELRYTEAFAGSGEFAVVRLVVDLMAAPERSLVLLDEPEVSLHPGAQERLVEFLFERAKRCKHQIVISTHSPAMIRHLPPEAVKVFVLDPSTGKVKLPSQAAAPDEAFFYLGEPLADVRTIVVEDALARDVVLKALRVGGQAFAKRFTVKFFPGGSKALWAYYLPIFAAEERKDVLVLLDGDERPEDGLPDPSDVPLAQEQKLADALKKTSGTEVKFVVDGGAEGGNAEQLSQARRHFIAWARKYVDYLPSNLIPEEFIWQNMQHDDLSKACASVSDPKKRFEKLARYDLGRADYEAVSAPEILTTQLRYLRTVPDQSDEIQKLHSRLATFVAN